MQGISLQKKQGGYFQRSLQISIFFHRETISTIVTNKIDIGKAKCFEKYELSKDLKERISINNELFAKYVVQRYLQLIIHLM